jgi:HD-like signal output (HDOD) protein
VFLLAPNVDPSDVVDASLHNVGLAAKLLQLSNSTFFRGRNHNSSIEVAVNCVGLPTVRGLTDVAEVLWPAPEHAVQYLAIAWRHAVATTYLVELMASPADRPCAQAAALLQDVGRLGCIASGSDPGESPVDLAAPDYGGVPFRDVGVDLLHLWGLPAQVVGAVAERDAYHRASASGLGVVGAVRAAHLLLQDTEAGDPLVGAYHDELAELLAHPQLRAAGIEWRQAAELASTRAFRWVPPSVAEPATPAEFEIEDGRGADLGR